MQLTDSFQDGQHLAEELFSFAGLEVQSGKGHEQITNLRNTVVLAVCCVVLVKKLHSEQY